LEKPEDGGKKGQKETEVFRATSRKKGLCHIHEENSPFSSTSQKSLHLKKNRIDRKKNIKHEVSGKFHVSTGDQQSKGRVNRIRDPLGR